MCKKRKICIKLVVAVSVFVSNGGNNEEAVEFVEDFIRSCSDMGPHHDIDIEIVNRDTLKTNEKSNEIELAKNLHKLIENNSKEFERGKGKKGEHHGSVVKVFILHHYPASEAELLALMDFSFKYPILDSVVRIVCQKSGSVISSMNGPESTMKKAVPTYNAVEGLASSESKEYGASERIDGIDVVTFLQSNYHLHSGHITVDEILALKPVDESDDYVKKDFNDMLHNFITLCSALWDSKNAFKEWSKQTKTVDVPFDSKALKRIQLAQAQASSNDMSGVWTHESLYATYRGYVNLLPAEVQNSTAALFGIVVSVAHMLEEGEDELNSLGIIPTPKASVSANNIRPLPGMNDHGSLEGTLSASLFAGLTRAPLDEEYACKKNLLIFEDGDRCAIKSSIAARYYSGATLQPRLLSPGVSPRRDGDNSEGVISLAVKNACKELSNFESSATFRAQVPRLLGQGGIPLRAPYTKMEKSIRETELLTFSSLSPSDLHRFNAMYLLENMIESIMSKRVNFTGQRIGEGGSETSITKRQFLRKIPGFTLPQILAKDLATDPVVLREYYPLADQLLLAFVWVPPDRRLGVKEWNPSKHMRSKPTYEEFRVLTEKENFTPRTAGGLQYAINMTTGEMAKYQQTTSVMTPSDKSIVHLKYLNSTDEAWVSVHVKDSILGLRTLDKLQRGEHPSAEGRVDIDLEAAKISCGVFVCNTEDDVRITASAENIVTEKKPDRKCFVRSTMTFANGMIVLVSSQGMIHISAPQPIQSPKTMEIKDNGNIQYPFDFEYNRMISNGGIVVRTMGNGYIYKKDILSADGTRILVRGPVTNSQQKRISKSITKKTSTPTPKNASLKSGKTAPPIVESAPESKETFINSFIKDAPENWRSIYLGADGSILYFTGDENEPQTRVQHDRIKNIEKTYIDAETRSRICEYRDGRIITHWADEHIREVRFPDGTIMTSQLQRNLLYIEKPMHPSIEVDVAVDKTSRKHAMGQQVPIALGGERVRSRIAMPDGSAVFIKYNTTVTAQYNGSIKIVRRNRESIIIEDGGIVTYRSPTAWTTQSAEEFHNDCKDGAVRRNTSMSPNTHEITVKKTTKKVRTAGSVVSESSYRTKNSSVTGGGKSLMNGSKLGKRDISPGKSKVLSGTGDINTMSVSSISSEPSLSTVPNRRIDQTKYIFYLTKLACKIEDNENNIFEFDFFNPLSPRLALAGEVDGLKPKAITETFAEPRTYIVDRTANAIEVIREQEVFDLEALVLTSPDASKQESDAHSPPCDLGGAKSHTYFNRRRLGGNDGFKFEEIFSTRYWHHYKYPMASSIIFGKLKKKLTEENSLHYPKVYEVRNMIEYPHLSQAGYQDLKDALKKWNEWRVERAIAIDKFRTVDPRTEEDKVAEKEIVSKLKKAYKLAKTMAHKKREKERERAAAAAKQQNTGMNLDLTVLMEEDADDMAEFSDEDYDEDEEFVEDPESIEIRECFDNYCVSYDDDISRIPMEDLRSALVQIFNRFVPETEIKNALQDDVLDRNHPDDEESLTIEEFRRLYFKIRGPEGLPHHDPTYGETRSETLPRKTTRPVASIGAKTSKRNFWQTSIGENATSAMYSNEVREEGATFTVAGDDEDQYVAGSALQAARRGKDTIQ